MKNPPRESRRVQKGAFVYVVLSIRRPAGQRLTMIKAAQAGTTATLMATAATGLTDFRVIGAGTWLARLFLSIATGFATGFGLCL